MIGVEPPADYVLDTLVKGIENDKTIDSGKYWIESSCRAHLCNGKIFSIATNRINNKKVVNGEV
jgi:hypothetical protein